MKRLWKVPRSLSYANVMATVALFVALGGSSYAAVKITGDDVRDGSPLANHAKRKGKLPTATAAGATTWSYRRDVAGGNLFSDLPDLPGLAQLTIVCDVGFDGTGRLYVHNTSNTKIDVVADLHTTGESIPQRLEELPLDTDKATNIRFPPGVNQLTMQIFAANASAAVPVATVTASYLGAPGKCDLTASASYQDPEHGA